MENEKRIGVYVCWCGTNIAKMVDVEAVAKQIALLPDVVISKDYKYMCSDPGQDLIIKDIKEHKLDRVVVAACSPRIHELTFRKALVNAGLNQYMFQMANIREHVSWVHTDYDIATKKAISLVAGAVNRIRWHESLDKRSVEINDATLVIGGGIAGLTAALEIADSGKQIHLIEKTGHLGGMLNNIDQLFPSMDSAQQLISSLVRKVSKHPLIKVYLNKTIEDIFGFIGNFEITFRENGDPEKTIKFGNVIVATGLKPFDPKNIYEYGYSRLPDVITSLELESMLKEGKVLTSKDAVPKNVAIIHCVGSRNKNFHEYCSRVCCATALKLANQLRSAFPSSHIYQVYDDMRAIGKECEEFYSSTARNGVTFLMFDQDDELPQVRKALDIDDCELIITMHEKLSGEQVEVPVDMIVLMVAMEAHNDSKMIGHGAGISTCGHGFFIERHPKLDPVATTTDGVYIVGSCQAPKDIPDTVSQARAAAARIMATIKAKSVEVEVTTAVTNEEVCCGCQTCVQVCPYRAISYDDEKSISVVNEVLCKGCGTCGSACPTGAIRSRHFTDKQILAQIKGLLSKAIELQEN
jgi:heterodisulfide reductase subunit A